MTPARDGAAPAPIDTGDDAAPSCRIPLPWRRLRDLMLPARRPLAGMLALSIAGSLAGTIQPVVLGRLIDALVARVGPGGAHASTVWWAAGLVAAMLVGAVSYAASDVLYAAAAARIFRDLRLAMARGLDGLPRRPGIASRFVSDVERVEGIAVGALDHGTIALFELVAGLVAVGLLVAPAAAAAAVAVAVAAGVSRLGQGRIAERSTARQEALEELAAAVEGGARSDLDGDTSLPVVAERLRVADLRLAVAHAVAGYGSYAAAGVVPVAVVLVGGGWSLHRAGTILSLYLLTERAARAAEALVDLGISVEDVRGPLARCLALVDGRQ